MTIDIWVMLAVIFVISGTAWYVIRQKNQDIEAANARAGAWHQAAIEVNAHWLGTQPDGPSRVKVWRNFARYNPPEVVLELLQLQQESKEKSDDRQDRKA